MNIELFRSLRLVVLPPGITVLFGCLPRLWIQHERRNEVRFRRKPKWKDDQKYFGSDGFSPCSSQARKLWAKRRLQERERELPLARMQSETCIGTVQSAIN